MTEKIENALASGVDDFEIARILKSELKEYFSKLPDIFRQDIRDFIYRHTKKMDDILKTVYMVATRRAFGSYFPMKNSIPVTVVALGSYGREQLCIKSDIDVMFVYKDLSGYDSQAIIEKMLYILWDSGLKLGHRVHEVSELYKVSQEDITIKSALLESRFVEGSKFLWAEVENELNRIRKDKPTEYIRAKLYERREMKIKHPLTMEPNIKEGVGGFRDANTVFWIAKVLYNVPQIKDIDSAVVSDKDYREFRTSLDYLYRVRNALHIINGKKEDRLRLELLPEVASILGVGEGYNAQLRFAKNLNEKLKSVNLYSRIWIEEMICDILPEFYDEQFLPAQKDYSFCELIRVMSIRSMQSEWRAHPRLLKMLIDAPKPEHTDGEIYEALSAVFDTPHSHSVLRALSEAKLLGFVIPAMKKVISLPQFDGYHRYTVDKHSLKTLEYMENIEDEFIASLFEALTKNEKKMLKITALLHDAGKGRKRDHHLVGASLFRVFASKIGIDENLKDMGERLVQYHTLMSVTAQREDIYSEKVVLRFLSRFGNKKMLDMIYILTYSDMKGVGTDVYNPFSSKLIRKLYDNAVEALDKSNLIDETAKRMKRVESLQRSGKFQALPVSLRKKILSIPSNAFFIRHTNSEIIELARLAHNTGDFSFTISNEKFLTITIIRRRDINIAYILHRLSRLEVVGMDIAKLFDDLKYFKIDFRLKADDSEIELIEQIVRESFMGGINMDLIVPVIHKDEIDIDCEHSKEYASMKIKTKDQKGLLAYIIDIFDRYGIDISSAKIHTIKSRANDLFLIEKNGNFCHNIESITKELTESVCAE